MKRQVEYNFLVVDGQTANPASSLDDLTGVVEFEDVSSGPTITAGPVVVVKVVDREAQGKLGSREQAHRLISQLSIHGI